MNKKKGQYQDYEDLSETDKLILDAARDICSDWWFEAERHRLNDTTFRQSEQLELFPTEAPKKKETLLDFWRNLALRRRS